MGNIVNTDFTQFDVIIIGSNSGYTSTWGDPASVDTIVNSNKPILGLGEGGYAFYGKLSLNIGSPNGGHGSGNNIFVAQFAPNGALRWSNSMGGTSNSLCNDEAGNLYLAGSYQYPIIINGQALNPWAEFDAFVVSLDSSGQFRWTQTLVGPDQIISSDILWNAQRQELYVSGILQGTIYFGNDSLGRSSASVRHLDNDIFIISFDRQGLPLYSQKFGGTDGDWVASLVWDSLGGSLYMYGTYSTITNIGGSILNAFGGA